MVQWFDWILFPKGVPGVAVLEGIRVCDTLDMLPDEFRSDRGENVLSLCWLFSFFLGCGNHFVAVAFRVNACIRSSICGLWAWH